MRCGLIPGGLGVGMGILRNLTILVPIPLNNSGSLIILLSIILVNLNIHVLQQKNLAAVKSYIVFSCLVSLERKQYLRKQSLES